MMETNAPLATIDIDNICDEAEAQRLYPEYRKLREHYAMISNYREGLLNLKKVLEGMVIMDLVLKEYKRFSADFRQLELLYLSSPDVLTFNQTEKLLLGVGLMQCLRDNDLAEFHTKLHSLLQHRSEKTSEEMERILDDPLIHYPLSLEKQIVSGNVARVLEMSRREMPHPLYIGFTTDLSQTMATRVCNALESAYKKCPTEKVMRLLDMQNMAQLNAFIQHKIEGAWQEGQLTSESALLTQWTTNQHEPQSPTRSTPKNSNLGALARTNANPANPMNMFKPANPVEMPLFKSKEAPKLWTFTPDKAYVEFIDTAAKRTYISAKDSLSVWLKATEDLEAI